MSGQTSKLEAVNRILAVAGDEPLNSLDTTYPQVDIVLSILANESRRFQSRGWYFNEERNKKLTPDINNEIILSENVLSISVTNDRGNMIQRGNKIYDRSLGTYTISNPVYSDLIFNLEFEDLPEAARQYLIAKCREIYNQEYFNDDNIKQQLAMDSNVAEKEFKRQHGKACDSNVFNNPTTANILRRRG